MNENREMKNETKHNKDRLLPEILWNFYPKCLIPPNIHQIGYQLLLKQQFKKDPDFVKDVLGKKGYEQFEGG